MSASSLTPIWMIEQGYSENLMQWFNDGVNPAVDDECYLWNRRRDNWGYGKASVRVGEIVKTMGAHRLAWMLFNGRIPEGLFVLHHCDTPACVRLSHLFLGTPQDNMTDMKIKGRGKCLRGEDNPTSKLTWPEVRRIREIVAGGETMAATARMFHVGRTAIRAIILRDHWKE